MKRFSALYTFLALIFVLFVPLMHVDAQAVASSGGGLASFLDGFGGFLQESGFYNATWGHILMIVVGLILIYLAVQKGFEPLLLVPIGTGIIIGNIPIQLDGSAAIGIDQEGSVYYLNQGVKLGIYPL